MSKILWSLVTALLSATLAITGYSADPAKDHATTAAATGSMMGEHDMTGTIERIDHKTGVVKIAAKPHDLELHFPPDAIKDLKKGDKITVHLAFQKD